MKIFATIFTLFLLASCASKVAKSDIPAWYIQPKQNNQSNLYGVAEGFTLEEATKTALADAAARLIVSISSESTMLREENNYSANEETRSKIKQNIEKIDFVNFSVSRSAKNGAVYYVEVAIDREQFLNAQKEKMQFLDRQITDLEKNIATQNLIQKRNSYVKMLDLLKQSSILAQILNNNIAAKNNQIAKVQDNLNKLNNDVEFYFEFDAAKEINAIIRNALNKEGIKIAKNPSQNANQIQIAIDSKTSNGAVYGAFITKLKIDFENKSGAKIIASNSIEVSGSSTLSEHEAYLSAIETLREKIAKEGVLQVLGVN